MDFLSIGIITVILSFSFYLVFLVIGVGGINKNRSAQGFDHNQKSDSKNQK